MTVGYMRDVATASSFTFVRLLFRWRGSVWKAIYWELLLWLFLFVNIRTIYDFVLSGTLAGNIFEQIVLRCRGIVDHSRTVITFALGFYVTFVTNRWWNVFMTIPWPDSTALQLTAYLRSRGKKFEVEDRSIRKSIMRYLILSYVLVFRDVSLRIKKRFPTYDHLTPTLMTKEERNKLEKYTDSRHWVPIEWALGLLRGCEKKGCIDNYHLCHVTTTILNYRQQLHDILSYDWISVPLVYVQAVNICTLSYFLILVFSSQTINDQAENKVSVEDIMETFVPFYSIIEFIVFNGWLKTAFAMLNPFGLDDDDFEVDSMIERNLMVSLSYVNDFYDKPPKLVDVHLKLPHTIQSAALLKKANPMYGSAVTVTVPEYQQRLLNDNQTNMLCKMQSMTTVQKARKPNDEITVEQGVDDDRDLNPRAPDISIRESGENQRNYVLKPEDLEAAFSKLLEKKMQEDMKMLSPQKTQSMSPIDRTQSSEHLKSTDRVKKKTPICETKNSRPNIPSPKELGAKISRILKDKNGPRFASNTSIKNERYRTAPPSRCSSLRKIKSSTDPTQAD